MEKENVIYYQTGCWYRKQTGIGLYDTGQEHIQIYLIKNIKLLFIHYLLLWFFII